MPTSDEPQAGTPATNVTVRVSVAVTVELIPEHYFTEPGFGRDPDIEVRRVHGFVSPSGHMTLQGSGKQIKADGTPGTATRNVYAIRALPDHLADKIRESAKAAIAAEAEQFAAL